MKSKYAIQVLKSRRDGRSWWWRIVHRNGQVVLTSELYTRLASALRSVRRFRAEVDGKDIIVQVEEDGSRRGAKAQRSGR